MLITLSGIAMLVKPLQLENAESPMLVTLSGIVMLVKLLQAQNAEPLINLVPLAISQLPEILLLTDIRQLFKYSSDSFQLLVVL